MAIKLYYYYSIIIQMWAIK